MLFMLSYRLHAEGCVAHGGLIRLESRLFLGLCLQENGDFGGNASFPILI
jgi:hypothetical protein